MMEEQGHQPVEQAGMPGKAAGVGAEVGVLRNSWGWQERLGLKAPQGDKLYDESHQPCLSSRWQPARWNQTRKAGYGKSVRPV
jgi:hypothetical protein